MAETQNITEYTPAEENVDLDYVRDNQEIGDDEVKTYFDDYIDDTQEQETLQEVQDEQYEPEDGEQTQTYTPQETQYSQYDTSPYAYGVLTKEEREALSEKYSDELLNIIENVAKRVVILDRHAQAMERQRAKEIGVSQEFMDYFGASIEKWLPYVPEHLRGTKEGFQNAIHLAIAEEATKTGDMAAAYELAAKLMRGNTGETYNPRQRTNINSEPNRPYTQPAETRMVKPQSTPATHHTTLASAQRNPSILAKVLGIDEEDIPKEMRGR